MKTPLFLVVAGFAALTLQTSCKKKPVAAAPEPEATAETSETTTETVAAAPEEPAAAAPVADAGGNRNNNNNNGGGRQFGGGNNNGGGQGNGPQRGGMGQRLQTELGLSDDQAQKIRGIYEQQFGALRGQGGQGGGQNMSREERRAAFEKARTAANAEVEALLTPEQKTKWDTLQKEMEQRRQQWQQNGGGNGGGGGANGGGRRNGGGGGGGGNGGGGGGGGSLR